MPKKVAFVPVRIGSKSIPRKNIKPLLGKPLILWVLEALQDSEDIDEIVVAHDSPEIERVVSERAFSKVVCYARRPENAKDESSTESVMLEYLSQAGLQEDDYFVLVQATNPFLRPRNIAEAFQRLRTTGSDSLLSAVRDKSFRWSSNGQSLNYDYGSRPRRQDFEGELRENGAFYISTVGLIQKFRNRLGAKIAVYEMHAASGFEIDEPEDWLIVEALMQRQIRQLKETGSDARQIKLFAMDVDGVLTDAGMYYMNGGEEAKRFNTHDGMGIAMIRRAGAEVAILTSENTQIVANRARKLNISHVYQGVRDKLTTLQQLCQDLGISIDQVAYIGDDVNDLDLLKNVGYSACPRNATPKIQEIAGIYHLKKAGGEGAVREWVDYLLDQGFA